MYYLGLAWLLYMILWALPKREEESEEHDGLFD